MHINTITAIQIEGNLLAADITSLLSTGSVKGQQSEDFGLAKTDKLADEIAIAWGDAKAYWAAFQRKLARLQEDDTATTITREWAVSLLESLGYKPILTRQAEEVDGQTYAISHRADAGDNKPPIHIVGCRLKLDQRPPSGTPRLSAHGLVQEYLNKTEHLWAITTNGYRWRLLRDSTLMTRLSYIEFDLEQILNGENFAEFGIFYRLFHRSRLPEGMDDADKCLLEFYHQETLQQGGRVRDKLRDGVEEALRIFGNGFIQHPDNEHLRKKISDNYVSEAPPQEALRITNYELKFYRQLLRLIYRLLFLMVAEARELLLIGEDVEKGRIYREYYSVERLRRLAEKPSYRREGFQDLWRGLCVTFKLFDENWRGQVLGLSPLNGDLFGSNTLPDIDNCAIDNYDLLQAIKHLSLYVDKNGLRRVNYANLDVEELGSVYESLLDFHPQVRVNQGIYEFVLVYGSDRKTTGSFYTPPQLVQQLIKTALEPVIQERLSRSQSPAGNASPEAPPPGKIEAEPQKSRYQAEPNNEDKEKALLSLKIVDPACGSGHFLLAAARRIGKELARVRTGETEPGKEPLNLAIRDVIQNCIYGVDLNPLAVDLCKVALWIEGFYSGMPLNFLDHRIKCGNSLVGVLDLEVLKEGIPDEAYKAVTGDNKTLSTQLKKRNKKERENQGQLTIFDSLETERSEYIENARVLGEIAETTPQEVREKQARYKESRNQEKNPGWWRDFSACNLWTAAFFMGLTEDNLQLLPTTAALSQLLRGNSSTQKVVDAANKLAEEKRFFHWCLEFAEVFDQGGFDCVLGNPPWERIKLQEKDFFAGRDIEIANAGKTERETLIKNLYKTKPQLINEFENARHDADAESKFARKSGNFLLTAIGDVNTYALFSELNKLIINYNGRVGCIVPPGIATDDSTKLFIQELVKSKAIVSFYDFTNRGYIFTDLESTHSFSLLTFSKKKLQNVLIAAQLWKIEDVTKEGRVYNLSVEDIERLNPNTLNLPILRTVEDANLIKRIYKSIPILQNEALQKNFWSIKFAAMFHMTNDSSPFFRKKSQLEKDGWYLDNNLLKKNDKYYLPLYESKLTDIFNHRESTFAGITESDMYGTRPRTNKAKLENLENSNWSIIPRYWVPDTEVEARIPDNWKYSWLIGFRNAISAVADSRSVRFAIIPKFGVGNSMPLIFSDQQPKKISALVANFNSLVLDYVAKQKASGGNLNFYVVKQLPILTPESYTQENIEFITPRVLELVYTAWDMQPFAKDMGYNGEPFIWNSNRRAILRAELDAYYAKLYGLTRDELRYILDPADIYGADFPSETFRVLKNNEIKQFGEYRTQKLVLEAWDKMFERR
jgi:hypothetical protein